MIVTVRYYAAAKAATGVEAEAVDVPDGATLVALLAALDSPNRATARSPEPGAPELGDVLRRCSFLVNEVAAKDPSRPLGDGDTVDILPPFAGG
ncbi:MoaD/ThiS family protein [Sinomonas sp. ASV322]|uniref:MoaD/ThiS family protein n=1 Tax=Sinomonas sp. ASV322 TaxID=3041920 RepID=UPI0027DC4C33|nr:MoaD/ThiS family protein [Sinomonas sp. ASV322]MDQ4502700.1 MoaD/ThiS family protein [Sinomonas sp. ASV322]